MDGALANGKRRLLYRLGASGVGMAGSRQILGRTPKLHQNGGFMDHFAGFAADYMDTQHTVCLRICENLHETVSGLIDL